MPSCYSICAEKELPSISTGTFVCFGYIGSISHKQSERQSMLSDIVTKNYALTCTACGRKYELSIRVALRAATFIIEHDWKATHGLPTRYWSVIVTRRNTQESNTDSRPVQYAALTATSALFHLYCHAQGQEEEKTLGNLVSAGIRILK